MKLSFSNIGKISNSKIELGKLTLLCGKNNTGKTYLTYSIYGFLKFLSDKQFSLNNFDKYFDEAIDHLDATISLDTLTNLLRESFKNYSSMIGTVLAVDNLNSPKVELENIADLIKKNSRFDRIGQIQIEQGVFLTLQFTKNEKDNFLHIICTPTKIEGTNNSSEEEQYKNNKVIRSRLSLIIQTVFKDILVEDILNSVPKQVFISSVERTGIAVFNEELFSRNETDDTLLNFDIKNKQRIFLKGNYPYAVKDNIRAVKNYHNLSSYKTLDDKKLMDIQKYFQDIISGTYRLDTTKKAVKYIPNGKINNKDSLSLIESSSSIRSLLDIGIYIQFLAKQGQTLIIDEPEMNLHPCNQRKIARLIAMLVNYGINIILTTHSDFITRELSFLIMMKQNERWERIKLIPEITTEYNEDQLLNAYDVKVYSSTTTDQDSDSVIMKAETVTAQDGFTIPTFDDTVDKMNAIYDTIL